MFQPCTNVAGEHTSSTLCHFCQQNQCVSHLNEHNDSLTSQLNPIIDSINKLNHQYKTLVIHETIRDYHKKLEEWRIDCYKKIDHIFEEKRLELDRLVADILDKQRNQVSHVESEVLKYVENKNITQQNIETFRSNISQLNEGLKQIENIKIQLSISQLNINDTLIYINKHTNAKPFDLAHHLSSVYKEIDYKPGSYCPVASSDQLLLIHQAPNLCFLNTDLVTVKELLWSHGPIRDICWSSILNKFIIVAENNIFLVSDNTLSVETVETIEKRRWFSCTCSDSCIYLTTGVRGSSIVEFQILPSITAIKEWKSPNTCAKSEFINGIVCKHDVLAIIIKNKVEKTLRLELRSRETLSHIWSLPIQMACNQNIAFRFCSISQNEWLIADYENGSFLQITDDGKLKTSIPYEATPYYTCSFSSNLLVVSAAKRVYVHKI